MNVEDILLGIFNVICDKMKEHFLIEQDPLSIYVREGSKYHLLGKVIQGQFITPNEFCDFCEHKGCCCYHEDLNGNSTYGTSKPSFCKNLNPKTGLCKDYYNRLNFPGGCLCVDEMLRNGTVPVSCHYVLNKNAYRKRKDRRFYRFEEENI